MVEWPAENLTTRNNEKPSPLFKIATADQKCAPPSSLYTGKIFDFAKRLPQLFIRGPYFHFRNTRNLQVRRAHFSMH